MLRFPLRGALGAVALMAIGAVARPAFAAPTASPEELPPPGEYQALPSPALHDGPPVRIQLEPTGPGLSYRMRPDDRRHRKWESCDGTCTLFLSPGRYRLEVFEHGRRTGSETVRVKQGAIWHMRAQNLTLKWVGLGMGVGGSVAAFAGLDLAMLTFIGAAMCEDPNCVTDADQRRAKIGLGLMFGGGATLTLGWYWFAKNHTPIASVETAKDESWLRRVRFGVAPTRDGAHISAGWTF